MVPLVINIIKSIKDLIVVILSLIKIKLDLKRPK
jgi:hypothetical protein